MATPDINRTSNGLTLPAEVSSEIIQKVQEESAIMRLSRNIALPGRGLTIPVITGDPKAEWVSETAKKPVSNGTVSTKLMTPYKIAVIETFSNEFRRDAAALYDALIQRLPGALAGVFDSTIIGETEAPSASNFDTFADCKSQSILDDTYMGLVDADADIASNGGTMNGLALSAQARAILLKAVDANKRPIFLASANDGVVDKVLGVPTYFNKRLHRAEDATHDELVGIAGDWSQAMYGTVEGITVKLSDTATLGTGEEAINLWQQNMFAVLAEIEVGFRAEKSVFNLLTGKKKVE